MKKLRLSIKRTLGFVKVKLEDFRIEWQSDSSLDDLAVKGTVVNQVITKRTQHD